MSTIVPYETLQYGDPSEMKNEMVEKVKETWEERDREREKGELKKLSKEE